jgi:hypothetical protein
MPSVKITNFLGKAPKMAEELLPNTSAQIATNCKLISGNIIPYPEPNLFASTNKTGPVKTLYALRDPDTDALRWLSWENDVDIAVATSNETGDQRFYYTGDTVPKVSNYELVTSGPVSPVVGYDLGLPIPPDTSVLSTLVTTYTAKTTSSYARDVNNTATIVTTTPHLLRTGNFVTITGFIDEVGTYSQTATVITVTISNHGLSNGGLVSLNFTSGNAIDGVFSVYDVTTSTFKVTAGNSVNTSGNVRMDIRAFNAFSVEVTVVNSTTFTYFSPGPEVATKTNTTGRVNLSGLTQARTYVYTWYTPWDEESIASKPSETIYLKEGATVTISDLPTAPPSGNNFIRAVRLYRTVPSVSGTEYYRLATMWFPNPVVSVGRNVNIVTIKTQYPHMLSIGDKVKLLGTVHFDGEDYEVTDIPTDYTFTFSSVGSNLATTAVSGTLYYNVAQLNTQPARYWGVANYNFLDDFDSLLLFNILESDEYDPPPPNLSGLISAQNGILAGFVNNVLYFSEPGRPHAWPDRYKRVLPSNIVGLAAISGSILVATEEYPYVVSGSDPAAQMSIARIDVKYPCVSKRSIVALNSAIVYATHDGLAIYSPGAAPGLMTKQVYDNDTWGQDLDPSTLVAVAYNDQYLASHSDGAIIFIRDEQTGGYLVDSEYIFSAPWFDSVYGVLYFVEGTQGNVYKWNDLSSPPSRIVWKSKVLVTEDMHNIGAARVIADYQDSLDPIEFKFWVDKKLIYTNDIISSRVFRLPTGYRTDTFEVQVSGNVRIRAIHLGETPTGLKTA